MIISEKQIMQLMDLARGYKNLVNELENDSYIPNLINNLLGEIVDQQSEELKVIE